MNNRRSPHSSRPGLPSTVGQVWAGMLALILAASVLAAAPVKTVRPDGTTNRAAWMAAGTFGVMTHYLPGPPQGSREVRQAWLDRTVDGFDLPGFMRQFDETGADWLILPLTQNNGVLNSANPKLPTDSTFLTCRRDLLLEIARQVDMRKKRLILYLPSDSEPSVRGFLNVQGDYWPQYLDFVRAFSDKFGPLCAGWWFDSCGAKPDDQWNLWLAACRSGNSNSVVAFSGAEFCTGGPIEPRCRLEDYHAGEIHMLDNGRIRRDFMVPGSRFFIQPDGTMQMEGHAQPPRYHMPESQFIGGVQWHCLLPIDLTFNPAIPNRLCHYPDQELFSFVDAAKSVGGAVTINVPIEMETGHIQQDSQAQLVRLGKHLREQAR